MTSSIQTPGADGVLLGGSVRYVGRFDHHLEDWFDCNWCEIQFTYRAPATGGAVCRRRVRTMQTVQKPWRLHSEVLLSVFTCLSVCSDRCFGPDSAVLCLTLQVQFLDKFVVPVLCNDKFWTVQKTVEMPQVQLLWGCRRLCDHAETSFRVSRQVVDVPVVHVVSCHRSWRKSRK